MEIKDRLALLEAQLIAQELTFSLVMRNLWPGPESRREALEMCRKMVESTSLRMRSPQDEERRQDVLFQLDQLFNLAGGTSKPS